jgi:peptide-methionine (S)-S-oxide reductase
VPRRQKSVRHRFYLQYLSDSKNPYGYCPDHGTGVSCPIGVVKASGPAEAIKADG